MAYFPGAATADGGVRACEGMRGRERGTRGVAAMALQGVCFSDTEEDRASGKRRSVFRDGFGAGVSGVLSGKRVIVVEDEGVTQMQLRRLLALAGLVVAGTAGSGPEGVDLALRERPDLVLMDIRMPGEYDGLEAARRILAEQSVCVVMLTAFSEEAYRERAKEIGASGYVLKPVSHMTLLPQLEEAYRLWTPQ